MADEFEKNFQKHREAFRSSQAVDPEPSDEQTEMPDFVDKAAMNDRVVPKDDEEEDDEHQEQQKIDGETEATVINAASQ